LLATDDTFVAYVHDVLARATAATLLPFWTTIAAISNQLAYWEILNAFSKKGYSQALINQWDFGAEYQQEIALAIALAKPGFLQEGFNLEPLKIIDRRDELPTLALVVAGKFVDPDTKYGQVTSGEFAPDGGFFNGPWNEQDERLGRPSIRW
jgi:hypothetical protein